MVTILTVGRALRRFKHTLN
jgi:hypothetical protein